MLKVKVWWVKLSMALAIGVCEVSHSSKLHEAKGNTNAMNLKGCAGQAFSKFQNKKQKRDINSIGTMCQTELGTSFCLVYLCSFHGYVLSCRNLACERQKQHLSTAACHISQDKTYLSL